MRPEEVDALPFGAIVIDTSGTIIRYNQFEARLSQLDAKRVIGKNFFRDIAPCTAVHAFEGRMREFLDSAEQYSVTFNYRFTFAHGPVDVEISFMRLPSDDILIAVDRVGAPPKESPADTPA
jgi:photoactive yellow protein